MFELVPPPLRDWGALPQRTLAQIDTIMFHRIGPELDGVALKDATQIAAWFAVNGMKEIGSPNMPYTFVIPPAGYKLWQAVPLKVRTPHARSWNTRAVSVAFIGDFRKGKGKPSADAVSMAAWVALRIQDTLGRRLTVTGHTWVPDGTGWAGHDCPGLNFIPAFNAIEDTMKDALLVTV